MARRPLWFSDGPQARCTPRARRVTSKSRPRYQHASGLGWLPDGTLVVSALFEREDLPRRRTRRTVSADLRPQRRRRFRPTICSSPPTVAATSTSIATEKVASVWSTPDGTVRVVATGISRCPTVSACCPTVRPSSSATPMRAGYSHSRIEPDGSLGAPSVFADSDLNATQMASASTIEGAVWVGCYDTGEFLRVSAGGTSPIASRSTVDGRSRRLSEAPTVARCTWLSTTPRSRASERRVNGVDHAGAG